MRGHVFDVLWRRRSTCAHFTASTVQNNCSKDTSNQRNSEDLFFPAFSESARIWYIRTVAPTVRHGNDRIKPYLKLSMHYKSTIISLITTGKFRHLLTPWHITVNFENKTIISKKRNWFLIGFDENVVPFRYIRRIEIDTHLFGADMTIKVYGSGSLLVKSISKRGARRLREGLVDYNNQKPTKGMLI